MVSRPRPPCFLLMPFAVVLGFELNCSPLPQASGTPAATPSTSTSTSGPSSSASTSVSPSTSSSASVATSTPSASATPLGSGPCMKNADCSPDRVCGFAVSDRCDATGQCVPRGPLCNSLSFGCSCSGRNVNVTCSGYPAGYASEPVASNGRCGTPGSSNSVTNDRPNRPPACASGAEVCGRACCKEDEQCCPGGMANSFYCRKQTGGRCPPLS